MRPDEPLRDPNLDELDRAGFAKAFAHSILTMDVESPFVFSIEGEWGTGKTTVVEFIKYFLQNRHEIGPTVPLETDPIVIDFSPWWFSGSEDLLRQFVGEISLQLRRDKKALSKLKDLPDSLDQLAAALTAHPLVIPHGAKFAFASKLLASILRRLTPAKDVASLRKEIEAILKAQTQRIVVFLDDIDRLQPRELVQVFQVVKAIANLPHLIYVLSFDRTAVVEGLSKAAIHEPAKYIEKIIQSVWTLPTADELGIARLTSDVVSGLLEGVPPGLWEPDRWRSIYFDGLKKLIRSPRDLNRVANALRPTYPPIKSEVNGVDFIAFHALRILVPAAHEFILANREWLTTAELRFFRNENDERNGYNGAIDAMLQAVPALDRDPVSQMLETMFPMFSRRQKRSDISGEAQARWRQLCRVCSPDRFAFYDRLSIPSGAISSADLRRILRPPSIDAFRADLQKLAAEKAFNGESKLKGFLEYADANVIAALSEPERQVLLNGVFEVADEFITKLEVPSLPFWSLDYQFARLANSIVGFVPKGQARIQSVEEAWLRGSAISSMLRCFYLWSECLDAYHGGRYSQIIYFDEEELDRLRQTLEQRISVAARTGIFAKTPLLNRALLFWDQQGTSDGLRFAAELSRTDNGLVSLAVGALRPLPALASPIHRSDVSLLEAWTSQPRTDLASRFTDILSRRSSELNEVETIALQALIEEVKNPRDDLGLPIISEVTPPESAAESELQSPPTADSE